MLRDTTEGYRYLKQQTGVTGGAHGRRRSPSVAGRADRVRTLAVGVILDPNISVPLPFAGSATSISIFSAPARSSTRSLAAPTDSSRSPCRRSAAAAGSSPGAASASRRPTTIARSCDGRERYDENIRQRPAQASVWLLRPLTPRDLASGSGYDLDYTQLARGDRPRRTFAVPADQVVHGGAIRARRAARRLERLGLVEPGAPHRLARVGQGRVAADYDAPQRDFQRYGVSLARSRRDHARGRGRAVEGAWMAGSDLDRFSRYTFGTFDNRLRGYPSALIRYDRGAVLRTRARLVAPASSIRLDGFVDSAAVHDPGFGRGLRNYTGVGAAARGAGAVRDAGRGRVGLRLPRRQRRRHARARRSLRISGYKVF